MIYPSADIIEQRVGSRYSLVVLAAKRAKQIKEGAPVLIETASTNPLTIALEEIAAGKVTVGEAPPVVVTEYHLETVEVPRSPVSELIAASEAAAAESEDDIEVEDTEEDAVEAN